MTQDQFNTLMEPRIISHKMLYKMCIVSGKMSMTEYLWMWYRWLHSLCKDGEGIVEMLQDKGAFNHNLVGRLWKIPIPWNLNYFIYTDNHELCKVK